LLENNGDERLRAYVIFMPMLPGDTADAALARSRELKDNRVSFFWDPGFVAGTAWREAYDLDHTAWDVYFLYRAGVTWTASPAKADYAMTNHRAIGGAMPTWRRELFAAEARRLLANMD
jgi:hypothetical protein